MSGSGKSSLAFDTIYAEGQRRYVESLSAYARQFLSMMEKPDVDTIEGLSPAISIEQKSTSHNPRSTVGTITEIYDYLRLLYARVGIPRCPDHDVPLEAQTVSQMVDLVLAQPWESWFGVDQTIRVDVTAVKSPLRSLEFVTLKIKDAVCDHFRTVAGRRPDVNTQAPDMRIHAFLTAEMATLYIDTSGAQIGRAHV